MRDVPRDTHRRWLIAAIRAQVLPAFVRRGFEVVPMPQPRNEPLDRAFVTAMPFGRLRRAGPCGLEFVEIQLERSRAAIRLNIGIAPPGGIDTFAGHFTADDVLVGWLGKFYELYQCPFFRTWFSAKGWLRRAVGPGDYEALAGRVVGLIPEIEAALREGKRGPHMRLIEIDRAAELAKYRARTAAKSDS